MAEEPLNADQIARFALITKGVSEPFSPSPRSPTDAMDVHLGFVWEIVVEHVRDVFDIDAAAGDIGGDENKDFAVLESSQCLGSCRLALVAVDGICWNTHLGKLFCEAIGPVLGACEDDSA